MEKPFFFQIGKHQLFAMLHEPDDVSKNQNKGIVLCSPFAEEKLWSHRVFVNFSRLLANLGYSCLRFDYRGHGDSDCRFEETTIQTRIDDICQAVSVLRKKSPVEQVGVLGLRLGATLAVLSSKKVETDFLVLWDPILDGRKYIQQCLRSNLATQMAIHRKILQTRDQLIDDLDKGKHANIDGYLISKDLYQQIIKINLINEEMFPSLPTLFCKIESFAGHRSPNDNKLMKIRVEKTHTNSCYKTIQERAFWGELKNYFQRSEHLFHETQLWLESI